MLLGSFGSEFFQLFICFSNHAIFYHHTCEYVVEFAETGFNIVTRCVIFLIFREACVSAES